jgi:hypothetical protein
MTKRKATATPLDDGHRVMIGWLLWGMTVCAVLGCPRCMQSIMKEGPLHA